MWQDEYISENKPQHADDDIDESYFCWDHLGEWIGSADTIDNAREIISDYVKNRQFKKRNK
jgi:hypothetical protein